LKLSQVRLCRPRQWGACWITLRLRQEEFELERRFLDPAELSKRHAAKFVHHRHRPRHR
jgi:hypothetical protein